MPIAKLSLTVFLVLGLCLFVRASSGDDHDKDCRFYSCQKVSDLLRKAQARPQELSYLMCIAERIQTEACGHDSVARMKNSSEVFGLWSISESHLKNTKGCPATSKTLSNPQRSAACALAILRGQSVAAWNEWWNPRQDCSWKRCPALHASASPSNATSSSSSTSSSNSSSSSGSSSTSSSSSGTSTSTSTSSDSSDTSSGSTYSSSTGTSYASSTSASGPSSGTSFSTTLSTTSEQTSSAGWGDASGYFTTANSNTNSGQTTGTSGSGHTPPTSGGSQSSTNTQSTNTQSTNTQPPSTYYYTSASSYETATSCPSCYE